MVRDIRLLKLQTLSTEMRQQLLLRAESDLGQYLDKAKSIIEAVQKEGDKALVRFSKHPHFSPIPDDGTNANGRSSTRTVLR